LTNADYPGVPADRFEQWKALELKSVTIFLWATWGLLLIGTPITLVFATRFPGGALGIQALYLVLFLILLLFSAIPGTQAARLRKELGIRWPRK
jgi:MFS-type transporter involved in bile tolerance (Atg22 family)